MKFNLNYLMAAFGRHMQVFAEFECINNSIDITYEEYLLIKLVSGVQLLHIEGDLDASATTLNKDALILPNNLVIDGFLYLRNTRITALPDNLTVGTWLDVSDTKVISLPDNLRVNGGSIFIRNNQLAVIPKRFKDLIKY